MKKMVLAPVLAGIMLFSSVAIAAPSPTAETTINYNTYNYDYSTTTNDYSTTTTNNYNIKVTVKSDGKTKVKVKTGSSSSSSGGSPTVTIGSNNNTVTPVAGKTLYSIGQGGKVILNGCKSRATFLVSSPTSGKISSAETLAASVSGKLLGVVDTSAPGVVFRTARVNFYVGGLTGNENIAVYEYAAGKWTQIPVAEVRKDHVLVDMTGHGTLAFIQLD